MRVLVNAEIFFQQNNKTNDENYERYFLNPSSRLLLDEPLLARNLVLVNLDPRTLKPWESLGEWYNNDDLTAFHTTYGTGSWDFTCKGAFKGLTSLVDLAGGTGNMVRAITETHPNFKCIVFDQLHVVANCEGNDKVEFIGGDMFATIPAADAILLKMILHNWSDEVCITILKKCREAIPNKDKDGKVIIIDIAMDDNRGDDNTIFEAQSFYNMKMMFILGGKERNEREWAKLFSEAGFSHHRITPLGGLNSIIEAYP